MSRDDPGRAARHDQLTSGRMIEGLQYHEIAAADRFGPIVSIDIKGVEQSFAACARSLIPIVKSRHSPPCLAVAFAAPCTKGSNAQIVTFAESGTFVFIASNGPKHA